MCLIAWSWQPASDCPLLLAANRDEWLQRPAAPMHWWPAEGGVQMLAGRDLQGGGAWLGLSRDGRLAALTNVREADAAAGHRPSRGHLVLRFLQRMHPLQPRAWSDGGVASWAQELAGGMQTWAGFNLLLADLRRGEMHWISNRAPAPRAVDAGVHGLSNAALDTPWPKVRRLKLGLAACLRSGCDADGAFDALLGHLADPAPASPAQLRAQPESLPLTPQWKRGLSAPFIRLPGYGTRCSTLLRAGADGSMRVLEVQHQEGGARRAFAWNWRAPEAPAQ